MEVWDQGASRGRFLVRAHFLVYRQPPSDCVLMRWKEGDLCPLLLRVLIPFMKSPPSWPSHLLKASSPYTVTLVLGFNTNLQGTQTFIALSLMLPLTLLLPLLPISPSNHKYFCHLLTSSCICWRQHINKYIGGCLWCVHGVESLGFCNPGTCDLADPRPWLCLFLLLL